MLAQRVANGAFPAAQNSFRDVSMLKVAMPYMNRAKTRYIFIDIFMYLQDVSSCKYQHTYRCNVLLGYYKDFPKETPSCSTTNKSIHGMMVMILEKTSSRSRPQLYAIG